MKKTIFAIFIFALTQAVFAQVPNTDIYVMSMKLTDGKYVFGKPLNITNREGYDNQPSFTADGTRILYSTMPDTSQTEIYQYDLRDSSVSHLTRTSYSEYSPVMRPGDEWFSEVRVDDDKGQRLYMVQISGENEPYQVLNFQDSVAYYGWIDSSHVAAAMLNGKTMDLEIFDLSNQQFVKLMSNVGRCMMKIPGTDEFSFAQKTTDSTASVFRYNVATGDMMPLCDLPANCEDYAFTPDGKMVTGKDGKLLLFDASTEKGDWKEIADFSKTIGSFYRIAISPKGDKIAMVVYKGKKP